MTLPEIHGQPCIADANFALFPFVVQDKFGCIRAAEELVPGTLLVVHLFHYKKLVVVIERANFCG